MERNAETEYSEHFARGKALILLYQFHALRFPDAPAHHRMFTSQDGYGHDGEYVPEEHLTRQGLSVFAKEQQLRKQFCDMLRNTSAETAAGIAYDLVLSFSDVAYEHYEAASDLLDSNCQPLAPSEILPSAEVIEAMAEDFVRLDRERCEPLEQFIIESQTASS